MRILYFILAMAVFQPLTAQAETAFDESGSFQIARSFKLWRDSSSSKVMTRTLPGTVKDTGKNINSGRSGTGQRCEKSEYDDNGSCTPCPANGQCSGAADWWCQKGYWQNNKKCTACNENSTSCPGRSAYSCKDTDGNVVTTWKKTNRYMESTASDPNKCTSCPANQECNGTDRKCYGVNTAGNNWSLSYAYATNAAFTNCQSCNYDTDGVNLYECNGKTTRYCYGKNTAKGSFDNKYAWAANSGSTSCQACPSGAKCNGTQTYNCDSNKWRDNSQSDPNKCVKCPDNANCNGGTSYTCETAYWRNGSEQCVSCPGNATCNGTTTYTCVKDYWYDNRKSDPDRCQPCPTHGICPGGNDLYTCEAGYFVKDGACESVMSKTNCINGFTKKYLQKNDNTDDTNTVYCVQ